MGENSISNMVMEKNPLDGITFNSCENGPGVHTNKFIVESSGEIKVKSKKQTKKWMSDCIKRDI